MGRPPPPTARSALATPKPRRSHATPTALHTVYTRLMGDEDGTVSPDGLAIRRRRHERGWSPRTLIDEAEERHFASTGLRARISPNLLSGIEERGEAVPYETICVLADAFDCDPIDLVKPPGEDEDEEDPRGE